MKSIWIKDCDFRKRKALENNIEADVVIIGAGITGILIGYMLKEKGINPIIIEAEEICSGNTKNTTAKITSQHGLIYDYLIKEFGEKKAKEYAGINELAIETYRNIVNKNNIKCDFKDIDTYIYSTESMEELKKEEIAARKVGIDATIVEDIELPIRVKGALKFSNQGQFNPIKFLNYISKELTIYEHTRVLQIKDRMVITDKGTVTSNVIVDATHYPIMNTPGYYFLRMHQERSYVLALENTEPINGAYIGIDKKKYSFRQYDNLLLLGGEGHRTGKNEDSGGFDELRNVAKKLYPNSIEKYHWSAQDCMPIDNIPYIGQYSKDTPNLYVATGFKKWGMTTAMVSAIIISDMILGRKNEFSSVFSPDRFNVAASIKNLFTDGVETTKNFISQKINIPDDDLEDIPMGHGGIIDYEGKKVGVYREKTGNNYFVHTKCPHLGCELQWNKEELSWDCPCHGSRFDYKGEWIEGPATGGDINE